MFEKSTQRNLAANAENAIAINLVSKPNFFTQKYVKNNEDSAEIHEANVPVIQIKKINAEEAATIATAF